MSLDSKPKLLHRFAGKACSSKNPYPWAVQRSTASFRPRWPTPSWRQVSCHDTIESLAEPLMLLLCCHSTCCKLRTSISQQYAADTRGLRGVACVHAAVLMPKSLLAEIHTTPGTHTMREVRLLGTHTTEILPTESHHLFEVTRTEIADVTDLEAVAHHVPDTTIESSSTPQDYIGVVWCLLIWVCKCHCRPSISYQFSPIVVAGQCFNHRSASPLCAVE